MRICVFGSEGRMGRALRMEAGDSVAACYDVAPPGTPPDVPMPEDIDVVIDFSLPSAWGSLDRLLDPVNCALVTGTTGLGPDQEVLLRKWATMRPVFHASNMSVGVFVLGRLLETAGMLLCGSGSGDPGFSLEVVEIHHGGKLDSPSGTALRLVEVWEGIAGPASRTFGRSGQAGPRKPDEVGIHSLRGGDVTGEHQLHLLGPGERLVLAHSAEGRRTFAAGALRAARFVLDREPGLYSMEDMLGQEGGG